MAANPNIDRMRERLGDMADERDWYERRPRNNDAAVLRPLVDALAADLDAAIRERDEAVDALHPHTAEWFLKGQQRMKDAESAEARVAELERLLQECAEALADISDIESGHCGPSAFRDWNAVSNIIRAALARLADFDKGLA